MSTKSWRKSSYSGNENNCVELAVSADATAVRDSKQPNGPALTFAAKPFRAFLAAIK